MTFFGKNIRKIRTIKKLSQTDFGALFDITRATIGSYEEQRAEPKISTAISIANYFNISLDALLKKDITINELTHFDSLGRSGNRKEKLNDKKNLSEIPFLSADHLIEYPHQRMSNDFISGLDRISLPPFSSAKLRAFEVADSKMEKGYGGIRHGDILIGYVANLKSKELEINQVYVVITDDSVFQGRLKSFGDNYVFGFDNPSYEDLVIANRQVQELWRVYRWISSNVPEKETLDERITKLEESFEEIKRRISGY